jgi:hypothetical protein
MTKPVLQHGDSSKPKTQKKPNKDASKRGRKRKISEVSEMIDHEENSNKKIRETLMNEEANEFCEATCLVFVTHAARCGDFSFDFMML